MLSTERQNHVQLITLARPEKRNALHPDLIARLTTILEAVDADDGIRVVVLTGAGKSFCAGLDLQHLVESSPEARVAYMQSAFALFRRVYELRQPVIAAVNGPAVAGGFDLAAFCDIRVCSASARFAQTEILLGLTQIMYPLYHVIGLGRAKELALTGAVISAEEAYRIGLVSAVHPHQALLQEALGLAADLARRPPRALFETKRLGRELIEMDTHAALTRMLEVITERLRSDEHRAAVERYVASLGGG